MRPTSCRSYTFSEGNARPRHQQVHQHSILGRSESAGESDMFRPSQQSKLSGNANGNEQTNLEVEARDAIAKLETRVVQRNYQHARSTSFGQADFQHGKAKKQLFY